MPHYAYLGKFYKNGETTCREVLFIKEEGAIYEVDLLVIMMNPGSSHPKAVANYHSITADLLNKLVPTQHDKTQNQITAFMRDKNLKHACILNLTDVCNQKSEQLRASDCHYSQFLTIESAIAVIQKHAPKAKHVLIAWGCKKIFRPLIVNCKTILINIEDVRIFGYKQLSDRKDLYYYHPLKRGGDWLNGLSAVDWDRGVK